MPRKLPRKIPIKSQIERSTRPNLHHQVPQNEAPPHLNIAARLDPGHHTADQQITAYPVTMSPGPARALLALEGKTLIPAIVDAQGVWRDVGGRQLDVTYWVYAPDQATATGRDLLFLL